MLSVKQAARQLNITVARVRFYIENGRIKARKVGNQFIIESLKDYKSLPAGRPPKIPKLCYLIFALTPLCAYGYHLLFKYQGF